MSGLGRRYLDHHANELSSGGDFALPGFNLHYAPIWDSSRLTSNYVYASSWRAVQRQAVWHIDVRRDGANQLVLNALEFTVDDIKDLNGQSLQWRHDGETITVCWSERQNKGDSSSPGELVGSVASEWNVLRRHCGWSDPRVT